jgi:ribosomal protein S18 acetylase RimI-like enzyme
MDIAALSASDVNIYRSNLMALLQDAVDGGASVGFILPLDAEINMKYWSKIEKDVQAGERVLLLAREGSSVVGSVQLGLAMLPNGRHRAEVQKLLVHSQHRRKGVAKALLAAIEQAARDDGRSLLVLDTQQGSPAEALYERAGYTRVGVIPQYALSETGLADVDTVIFYKAL